MFFTSDNIGEIAAAIAVAQTRIESADKDAANPHFKSKYATLASVDAAVRPHLSQEGVAIVQSTSFDTATSCVVVTTLLAHKSGQWMRGDALIPIAKADAQGIGSATTYGRRYALAAMCGVAPSDDDDGEAAVGRANNAPPVRQIAPVGNAPKPAAQSAAGGISDVVRAKMREVCEAYGHPDDVKRMDLMNAQEKMTLYRKAVEQAVKDDPSFVAPY